MPGISVRIVVTSMLIFTFCGSSPVAAEAPPWCLAWIDNCSRCARTTPSASAACHNQRYPVGCVSGFHCLKIDEGKFAEECESRQSPMTLRPIQCNSCDQTGRCTQMGCPFEIVCIPKRPR